jgi:hypothetical protein
MKNLRTEVCGAPEKCCLLSLTPVALDICSAYPTALIGLSSSDPCPIPVPVFNPEGGGALLLRNVDIQLQTT